MENVPSWVIAALISIVGVIGSLYIGKYKIEQNEKASEDNDKSLSKYKASNDEELKKLKENFNKEISKVKEDNDKKNSKVWESLDNNSNKISQHEIQISSKPTMKDVDDKFITKEFFQQTQKHYDEKVDDLKTQMNQGFVNVGKLLSEIKDEIKK
jgi:membrane-associated HD superfamily phosphohydrolase